MLHNGLVILGSLSNGNYRSFYIFSLQWKALSLSHTPLFSDTHTYVCVRVCVCVCVCMQAVGVSVLLPFINAARCHSGVCNKKKMGERESCCRQFCCHWYRWNTKMWGCRDVKMLQCSNGGLTRQCSLPSASPLEARAFTYWEERLFPFLIFFESTNYTHESALGETYWVHKHISWGVLGYFLINMDTDMAVLR